MERETEVRQVEISLNAACSKQGKKGKKWVR